MNKLHVFETTSVEGEAIMISGERDSPFFEFADWINSEAGQFDGTDLITCPYVEVAPSLTLLLSEGGSGSFSSSQGRRGLHQEQGHFQSRFSWTLPADDWRDIAQTIRHFAETIYPAHIYLPGDAPDDRIVVVSRGEFEKP